MRIVILESGSLCRDFISRLSTVVVEGVARGFDPKLDIWKVADPVVREWIERNLGPVGRIQGAMSGASDLGRVLAGLPAIAERSVAVIEQLEIMTREGLTLSAETIAAMGRTEGRKSRWRTLALLAGGKTER